MLLSVQKSASAREQDMRERATVLQTDFENYVHGSAESVQAAKKGDLVGYHSRLQRWWDCVLLAVVIFLLRDGVTTFTRMYTIHRTMFQAEQTLFLCKCTSTISQLQL